MAIKHAKAIINVKQIGKAIDKMADDAEFQKITDALSVLMKLKFWNPHICHHCGAPFKNGYDSIQKCISPYLWKPTCKCYPDTWTLAEI